MEGGKKIAAIVVLLVVIVLAAVLIAKKSDRFGGPKIPDWLKQEKREKIDSQSGELVTLTFDEWRKLGHEGGKYKSPKTGSYTMVVPITCAACGEKIVPPEFPNPPEGDDPDGMQKHEEATMKVREEFKCPKCSKPAYEMEGMMPPAPPAPSK